ncbi:MAG: hypothetical protein WDN46_14240 [Methylocella sp.]
MSPPVTAAAVDEDCAAWKLQIELAEKRSDRWERRCKRIIKRYREERPDEGQNVGLPMRMNLLWSNVQTLQPSIYGREPVPIAEHRFLDRDVVGRAAAQILERAMRYELPDSGFHDTMEQCVLDFLLVGRGVPWLRFKPVIGAASSLTDRGDDELSDRAGDPLDVGEEPSDLDRQEETDGDAQTDEAPAERLLSANVEIDYVHWQDFFTSKARFWKEVEWVARRLFPSRQDLIDDFGEEIGKAVPLEMTPETDELNKIGRNIDQMPDAMKKAIVFEIWHKPTRKVYTIAKGFDKFLEEPREDPLNLEGFWPCPKPLFATMTNDTIEPVPDYIEYQDQAIEIDNLTNRISLLIKALKVAGVYDSSQKQLARLLDEGHENKLIPVSSWAAFAEKGGLSSAISFLPIKEISDVLVGLTQAREQIKKDLYEITGLADIMRGQADPRETAEAVQTKGRWGSLRLQRRQTEVARFCRDTIKMMGEIIAEHFPVETLINISGAMFDDGIGGPAPVAPKPPQSPMLGHNGGPPLGAPSGMHDPNGLPMPPVRSQQPSVPISPAGTQVGQPATPIGGAPTSVPPSNPMVHAAPQPPGGVGAPAPAVDPDAQFQMQMAQYQMQMQAHQQEKQILIMKAIDLLKQDKMRGFRIDIETDSTIVDDVNQDKQARTEFLKATTQFIEESFKIGQMNPDAVPMLGKMLLFGVRGFRAGRDLESTIEEFIDKSEKDAVAKQIAPAQPNPEIQKQQLELQETQAKSQAEIQRAQIDAQASAEDNQRAMATNTLDAQVAQQKAQMEMAQMQREAEYRAAEHAQKMAELQLQAQIAAQTHAREMEATGLAHQRRIETLMAPTPAPNGAA